MQKRDFSDSSVVYRGFLSNLALCLTISVSAFAQHLGPYSDITSTPLPGSGHAYVADLSETVNPENGALSVRIAAPTPKERGLTLPIYPYIYDSNGQAVPVPSWSFSTYSNSDVLDSVYLQVPQNVGGPNTITYDTDTINTVRGNRFPVNCTYWSNFTYTDPGGNRHSLYGFQGTSNSAFDGCGGLGIQQTATGQTAVDAPYTAIYAGNGTEVLVFDSHGNLLATTPSLGSVTEDTNGNYQHGTGRTYSSTATSTTIPGLGGPYTYSPAATLRSSASPFRFNLTPRANQDPSCPTSFSGAPGALYTGSSSLTLPNGQQYIFVIDAAYGLMNHITYPTGVAVDYVWGSNHQSQSSFFTLPSNTPSAPCGYIYDWPAVTRRVVSVNGVQTQSQDFSYVTTWNGLDWDTKTTTVITTDLVRTGTPSFKTVYTYHQSGPETVDTYDTNGVLLTSVASTVAGDQLQARCVTHNSNGPTSAVFLQYRAFTNAVTDEAEYDFGAVTGTCQRPGSTPTRETINAYYPSAATTMSRGVSVIQDLVSSSKIYGNGALLAETDYNYDEYAPAAVAANGHDEQNYDPGTITGRGNVTTIIRKCFLSGSRSCPNSITHIRYDETGQPTQTQDANGNTTQYSFADSFTSDNGAPNVNTNTYLTKLTLPTVNGVAHIQTFQYGYQDGQLRASADENQNTTTFCYFIGGCSGSSFDPWLRLTQTLLPDGGGSTTTYNDAGPTPSVSTVTTGSPSPNVSSASIMDGMGRVTQTQLTSDPSGTTYTDTTYDGVGRTYTSSTPYRSKSEKSYGVTTASYDAIGRQLGVSYPDGSSDTWSYSGNQALYTDPTGSQWSRVSDGLGRLTRVLEPDASQQPVLETDYNYDGLDNLITANQLGAGGETPRARSFTYNSLSQLITSNSPETGLVCYGSAPAGTSPTAANCSPGYDLNGNILLKTDARQQTVAFAYDALNRLISKSQNGTQVAEYDYDGSVHSGAAPALEGNSPNVIGRLSFTRAQLDPTYGLTGAQPFDDQYFGYDKVGRMKHWTEAAPSEFGSTSHSIDVTYDAAGNVTSMTYPDGRATTQTFSSAGRLLSSYPTLAPNSPYVSSIIYSASGNPYQISYGNGVTELLTQNNRLQPCQDTVTNGSITFIDRRYFYGTSNVDGQQCDPVATNRGNILNLGDGLSPTRSQSFSYDPMNRISSWNAASFGGRVRRQNFNYDSFGNLNQTDGYPPPSSASPLTFPAPYNAASWPYDGNNHLLASAVHCLPLGVSGTPGQVYPYDQSGNTLCSGVQNSNAQAFVWDAESRLTQMWRQQNNNTYFLSSVYSYDGQGNRIRADQVIAGQAPGSYNTSKFREYSYFEGQILAEKDQTGGWTDYIYAAGKKIAKIDPAEAALHISGDNCSNCGGTASYVQLYGGTGYVFKTGDVLHLSQYNVGAAQGGVIFFFDDGTTSTSGLIAQDQNGQQINCNAIGDVLQNRSVDMSAYAGRSLDFTLLINDVCSPAGHFDQFFNNVSIVSTNGDVTNIYSPQVGATFSLVQSYAWPGTVSNLRAVAEANTFAPSDPANLRATEYYVSDHLGTAQMELSPGGWPVWKGEFAPFGQELAYQLTEDRYKFTGKERDAESGLDDFGARYYASYAGRWISPDTVNVTEERMMNPSSTLNKYAYGANNPLTYTDLDGKDITIFYQQGSHATLGLPGHTMLLANNQSTGDAAIRSFGPVRSSAADHIEDNPITGIAGTDRFDFEKFKSPDDIRRQFTSITIQTTPEEAQAVIQEIRTHPDGNYDVFSHNCTTTCRNLLRRIGKASTSAITPDAFFGYLYNTYGNGTVTSSGFQNGTNYGRQTLAYDPFSLFFGAIPDNPTQHEKVTVTLVDWWLM